MLATNTFVKNHGSVI